MSDDELLMVAASRADLVPEAAQAMDSEMARRRLLPRSPRKEKGCISAGNQGSKKTPFIEEGLEVFRCEGEWMDVAVGGSWLASISYRFDDLPSRPGGMAFPHTFRLHGRSHSPWDRSALAKENIEFLDLACCFLRRAVECELLDQHAPRATNDGPNQGSRFLTIIPGYAVGILSFFLLQKLELRQGSRPSSQ